MAKIATPEFFKEVAVEKLKFLTEEEFKICLNIFNTDKKKGKTSLLGQIAVENSFMKPGELELCDMALKRLEEDQGKEAGKSPIKGYKILKKLGEGGMGIVYKAQQESMRRTVALKVLHSRWNSDKEFTSRFLLEARLVGKLKHANLIQVYDVGNSSNHLFFSMEYVIGRSVEAIVDEDGAMDPSQVAMVAIEVLKVIEYLRKEDLVHRDIKPGNIMVTEDGSVKLGDFGFVKTKYEKSLSQDGMVVGTPDYISPEQAKGKDSDYRSDIYSLGVTMFHMLSGDTPFTGSTSSIMRKHVAQEAPDLRFINPGIPGSLIKVVSEMMKKDVETRPKDIASLIGQLEGVRLAENPSAEIQMGRTEIIKLVTTERDQISRMEENEESMVQQLSDLKFLVKVLVSLSAILILAVVVLTILHLK